MAYLHKTIATTCLYLFASATLIATAQSNDNVHTIKQGETLSAVAVKITLPVPSELMVAFNTRFDGSVNF